jgi:hypothetical protein
MLAHVVLDNEVINVIEVESLASFTPEIGKIVDLPEHVALGYYNYNGVWRMKREYITPQVIERRNNFLTQSDIQFLPDNYAKLSEEQKIEWANYRQALRDLPTQAGFPWEVSWPTKPQVA